MKSTQSHNYVSLRTHQNAANLLSPKNLHEWMEGGRVMSTRQKMNEMKISSESHNKNKAAEKGIRFFGSISLLSSLSPTHPSLSLV